MTTSATELDIRRDDDGVVWVTLDRPDKLNALTWSMLEGLHHLFTTLPDDRAARIVILRGRGRGFCAGVDISDTPYAKAMLGDGPPRELGIPVANVVASNSVAVAEYVVLATMYIVRRMDDVLQAGREGRMPWPSAVAKGMYQVRGRTMGILSYGSIGHEIAKAARGLGMKLMTASVPGRERAASAEERELGVERVSFDRMISTCDVLALVVPLTADTRNLFDRRRLRQMKKGSYLVNAARGGIVDEQALADLLHEGHLAGAAVDTFLVEPIQQDNPLWRAPNALLTPHCGGNTMESTQYVGIEAFENINRVGRGEEPRYRVC